jgi:hypothetical protein
MAAVRNGVVGVTGRGRTAFRQECLVAQKAAVIANQPADGCRFDQPILDEVHVQKSGFLDRERSRKPDAS